MKFYKNLYVSPNLKKKRTRIKWALRYGKEKPDLYVITPAGANDLLEVYHCRQLRQKLYQIVPPYIIGIADTYDAAIRLVQQILTESFAQTGSYDVKAFLQVK